jgi:mannose-1-phosphate guanylyltransferase
MAGAGTIHRNVAGKSSFLTTPKVKDLDHTAVILAGGEGVRLSSFIRGIFGYHIPKQFCPLFEGKTLLEQTMDRVSLLVPRSQTITVLTRSHEWFYSPLVDGIASGNRLIQPENRGTAPAILCVLLRLIEAGHTGAVAIFPSDHYVSGDSIFMRHVSTALRAVDHSPELTVLLGIRPDGPEAEYGWIEPGAPVAAGNPALEQIRQIRRFWEKPSAVMVRDLYDCGCLWNSFVLVANAETLRSSISEALPELCRHFTRIQSFLGTAGEEKALQAIYQNLPWLDFSRCVLEQFPGELAVLPVSGVSWSDLGNPERMLAVMGETDVRFDKEA